MEQKFETGKDIDGEHWIVFDTDRTAACIEYIQGKNIKRILVHNPTWFKADDLSPLLPLKKEITGLTILNNEIGYNGISEFSELTQLSALDNKKDTIDLTEYKKLESLNCTINSRLIGLQSCLHLKQLQICDYKSKVGHLDQLPLLKNVSDLRIISTDIKDLLGIENLPSLTKLSIYGAKNLTNLEAMHSLEMLEELELENCKNLNEFSILGNLTNLKIITLVNAGQIPSLDFLQNLNNLMHLVFAQTNVMDGNLNYCEGIDYVYFSNKKHYSHKPEDFKTNLAIPYYVRPARPER